MKVSRQMRWCRNEDLSTKLRCSSVSRISRARPEGPCPLSFYHYAAVFITWHLRSAPIKCRSFNSQPFCKKVIQMNGRPTSIEITGMVLGLDASGIGPNSGEITFIIKTDAGAVVEVFAGILD